MKKEFVMRGQTPSNNEEVLNFSGFKQGYAYRMTEFKIYPSTSIGSQTFELAATVTAAKTAEDPVNPNFNNEGLIASAMLVLDTGVRNFNLTNVINDTFLITQNLILSVIDTHPGAPTPVNWQCKFETVKMAKAEEAVTNYRQYLISDGS